jgi:hypothetical protein
MVKTHASTTVIVYQSGKDILSVISIKKWENNYTLLAFFATVLILIYFLTNS